MPLTISDRRFVLRFDEVSLMVDPFEGGERLNIGIPVLGGDLLLVQLERGQQGAVIADACTGLIRPMEGKVYFLGRDWTTQPPDMANALRGRIGHVFKVGNWIEHLSLLENILLPQLHHTRRSDNELRDEAAGLARRLGLPGLPTVALNEYRQSDLQRAACVRAFLGRPSLVILEDPMVGADSDMLPSLINVIREYRSYGTAVVWLTLEDAVWQDQSIPATRRYRVAGQEIREVIK